MKKNNNEPELETFTLLNPDFHTFENQNQITTKQPSDGSEDEPNLSTKTE